MRVHGINPTHQRIEIAHALYSRHEHLSADQVLAIVNERHPETSRATVYNTLNLFVAKNLIREVIVDPTRVFYDPNTSGHYHIYDVETENSPISMQPRYASKGCPPCPTEWLSRAWTSSSACAAPRKAEAAAFDHCIAPAACWAALLPPCLTVWAARACLARFAVPDRFAPAR